jgi:hypothetical protein
LAGPLAMFFTQGQPKGRVDAEKICVVTNFIIGGLLPENWTIQNERILLR